MCWFRTASGIWGGKTKPHLQASRPDPVVLRASDRLGEMSGSHQQSGFSSPACEIQIMASS